MFLPYMNLTLKHKNFTENLSRRTRLSEKINNLGA